MRPQQEPANRRRLITFCLSIFFFSLATLGFSEATDELRVQETSGAVKLRQEAVWQSPEVGMIVSLPAVISTGADGALKLKQSGSSISVAANTAIELVEGSVPGQPLQRVVQNNGSAFYDIESRDAGRLQVDTPYLVAVIKGTQFNVTVAAETTTVALHEGQLRIETPDGRDAVDLAAGQIAKRHKDDDRITVLAMDDGKPVARDSSARPSSSQSNGTRTDSAGADGATAFDGQNALVEDGLDAGFTLDDSANVIESDVDLSVDSGVDFDSQSTGFEVDAEANLADGEVDLGLDSNVDLGDSTVDAGLDAGADLGSGELDASLDGGVTTGDTTVDAGLDAGADLTSGNLDTTLGTDATIGDTTVDATVDATVDTTLDTTLDTTVDATLETDLVDGGTVTGTEEDLSGTITDTGDGLLL